MHPTNHLRAQNGRCIPEILQILNPRPKGMDIIVTENVPPRNGKKKTNANASSYHAVHVLLVYSSSIHRPTKQKKNAHLLSSQPSSTSILFHLFPTYSHPLINPIPHGTPRPLLTRTAPTHYIPQRPLRLPACTYIRTFPKSTITIPCAAAWTSRIPIAIQTHVSAIRAIITITVVVVPVVRVLRAVVF